MNDTSISDDLYKAHILFYEAFELTYRSYHEEEKLKVQEFIINFTHNYTPYGLIQAGSIGELQEHIFTVELHRDFLWKLIFNYYSLIGLDNTLLNRLLDALATALNVSDVGLEEDSLTPTPIRERLLGFEDIRTYLNANKWLVVLALIKLNYNRIFGENKLTLQALVERGS